MQLNTLLENVIQMAFEATKGEQTKMVKLNSMCYVSSLSYTHFKNL